MSRQATCRPWQPAGLGNLQALRSFVSSLDDRAGHALALRDMATTRAGRVSGGIGYGLRTILRAADANFRRPPFIATKSGRSHAPPGVRCLAWLKSTKGVDERNLSQRNTASLGDRLMCRVGRHEGHDILGGSECCPAGDIRADVGGGPDSDNVDVFYEAENMENREYNRTA
jgi:hypothetical protein